MNMKRSNSERTKYIPRFATFRTAVKADVVRNFGQYKLRFLIRGFLFSRTFRPVFTLRLCQGTSGLPRPLRGLLLFPCRTLHSWAQQRAGIDMSWMTEIGPGFLIAHGWGFVTGPGVVIGGNVTVHHGVTIGQKHKITPNGRVKTYPKIEDEVWIGPNAFIAGDVTIGRGARIAPGTIVIGDVEPYTVVGGNPMRVLKTDAPIDVINRAELPD